MGFLRPVLLTLIIIGTLQLTGLWSSVSAAMQMAVLKTGFRDADVSSKKENIAFDFNFTIKNLKGENIPFESFKGKVIFLNLWATWCGPCKAEMPGIQELANKLKDNQVEFVMLSIDREPATEKVNNYINKNNYTFPVYLKDQYVPELLRVSSIPTTFIINKQGELITKEVGTRNYNTKKMLNFLIEESNK